MDARTHKQVILTRHIARLTRRSQGLKTRADQLVRWRTAAILGAFVIAFVGFQIADGLGWGGFLLGMLVFTILARWHGQVKSTLQNLRHWRTIKTIEIARIQVDWVELPAPQHIDPPKDHPFAIDLDMLGERSVHHLLDTTVTSGGSARLADWLLATTHDSKITESRRKLVQELMPLTAFRNRLQLGAILAAGKHKGRWDGGTLLRWLNDTNTTQNMGNSLMILGALSAINIVLFTLFAVGVLPPLWLGVFVVYAFFSSMQWRKLAGLFTQALSVQAQLQRLSAIFHPLETHAYANQPALKSHCTPFIQAQNRPSVLLRRVSWVAIAASLQRNPLLWLALNFVVPWDIYFAHRLEAQKANLREVMPDWLDALYDLEALSTLATFASLNPDYVFPKHIDDPQFDARSIGHPLIAHEGRITNDFRMDALGQVIILTGSNMSGKSSFLRTLGVNLQLAYAGGVVCADALTIGNYRVFTSIRVSDSLADGFSYFYAEVRRLRALLDALKDDTQAPVFFLIDEIFRGTNNRERLLGSRAYIRALVSENGAGLIATHDLDLVKLGDESSQISNAHFREDVIDGKIVFDYTLREGPCPTTNALKIMAMEGLPVEDVAD